MSQAWRRWSLNATIVILGGVALILFYSLFVRVATPRVDPRREENPRDFLGEIMQVEVRNGCGTDGVARTATQFLRAQGFDVVDVGDHTTFDLGRSLVIDRVGDLAAARKLAASLGIDEGQVRQDMRPEYYLDASVILGRDYATLRPFQGAMP
ncbi:MAG: LytR C-terminal domain-containing protein [Bacteroidota bacterium]